MHVKPPNHVNARKSFRQNPTLYRMYFVKPALCWFVHHPSASANYSQTYFGLFSIAGASEPPSYPPNVTSKSSII